MALKPVTLRLDEEEYERLKAHLSQFGDPDINVAYVLRAYIRDVNRVMPFLISSGWDLKNYFSLVGYWLNHIRSNTEWVMFAKLTLNPWALWKPNETPDGQDHGQSASREKGEPLEPNPKACDLGGDSLS
jgi:hypothetical protein